MPRKAGRRKRISAEVVLLKTVRFKFWITGNSGILGSGCHSCRRELLTKTGCISLNAAFCRLVFLQLPSSQIDMAEACGSRICDDRSNRQCLCGVAHHTLLPISVF